MRQANDPTALLRDLFANAVAVADPMRVVPAALPPKPAGRVVVIGAGKASARMAEAVEAAWGPCEGLVITRYGYARTCEGIEIVEAAHPVPDTAGQDATARMLALLESLGPDDFVLALISGGASSLLVAPAGDITLAEKQAINAALLASGAPIGAMNILRKHLSRVKGGQLAAMAYPAQMLCLMISDVPGDDPAFIGSGPTVGDDSDVSAAQAIAAQWNIALPESAEQVLSIGTNVQPRDAESLTSTHNVIVAAPSQSLAAARERAEAAGFDVEMLGDALEGEARDIAEDHARLAIARQTAMGPDSAPLLLLSGGELTVTRRGDGVGGPNAEYALSLAIALNGNAGIYALACDTDGVDGAAEVAGAVVSPSSLMDHILEAKDALVNNDSHSFFKSIDGQVITGPTLTNVNDFRAIAIYPDDGQVFVDAGLDT